MIRRSCTLLPAFIASLWLAGPVRADEGSKVYLDGLHATVWVIFPEGHGSGSIIDLEKGYVLTNWHVVRNNREVRVVFPLWEKGEPVAEAERYEAKLNQIAMKAKVVAAQQNCDLAVIQLLEPKKVPKGTQAVRLATKSPSAGTKLVSIGNPGASGARWVYTPGETRTVYRKTWKASGGDPSEVFSFEAKVIEATSPTNSGDSGGPCFNHSNELVGVTQGGAIGKGVQGISWFIDITEVRNFIKAHKIHLTEVSSEVVTNPPVTTEPDPDPKKDPPSKQDPPPKKDPPKKDPPKKETDKDKLEKAAESELKLIRTLAKDPNRRDFAVDKLKAFIKKYAGTDAAKDAQRLLGQLE